MRCCNAPTPRMEFRTDTVRAISFEVIVCALCRAPLGMGESGDTINVNIEIRGVEIAHSWLTTIDTDLFPLDLNDEELRGWSLAETNMQHHPDSWQAGYLARCIATHQDPK